MFEQGAQHRPAQRGRAGGAWCPVRQQWLVQEGRRRFRSGPQDQRVARERPQVHGRNVGRARAQLRGGEPAGRSEESVPGLFEHYTAPRGGAKLVGFSQVENV
uniref:(northern house mosquito) hypothetical protein n=1 Tax=Culex pipiens TaxID=7175 RepID=A0A8D8JIA0_CULPI